MNKTLVFTTGSGRTFWRLPEAVQESLTRKLYLYGLTGKGDVKRMAGSEVVRMRDGDDAYRPGGGSSARDLSVVGGDPWTCRS
ncbi:hypothetical protein [Methylobacterium planeticum]|uniref:Uncharacterized protein n=1 Tax=Methylobacterium planeticum TaxID=2615211 RepID=A0A6N6MU47_9HYPH|nr:hypothetical protein [Methylobacterium planeticum]KAB1074248.1 hypothetical protein F6X51_07625 [Methylobacterium planeticum]